MAKCGRARHGYAGVRMTEMTDVGLEPLDRERHSRRAPNTHGCAPISQRDAVGQRAGRRVIIVGGGASGVLLACHLLRVPQVQLTVTLIEKRPDIGQGIAYSTANPDHVLNVRAANMSAFVDDPDHFWRWWVLQCERDGLRCPDRFCFAPRRIYGHYVASLIEPLRETGPVRRLEIIRAECVDVRVLSCGVSACLSDGSVHLADVCVLATGHETRASNRPGPYVQPWSASAAFAIDANAPVLLLGTGLTMVDHVLSLCQAGHRGPVTAMSRRGPASSCPSAGGAMEHRCERRTVRG